MKVNQLLYDYFLGIYDSLNDSKPHVRLLLFLLLSPGIVFLLGIVYILTYLVVGYIIALGYVYPKGLEALIASCAAKLREELETEEVD